MWAVDNLIWSDVVVRFVAMGKAGGKSPRTIEMYRDNLVCFCNIVGQVKLVDNPLHIQRFSVHQQPTQYSGNIIHQHYRFNLQAIHEHGFQ